MSELQQNRRLAAILAADVVGYSRLMGQDESDTVRTLTGTDKSSPTISRVIEGN